MAEWLVDAGLWGWVCREQGSGIVFHSDYVCTIGAELGPGTGLGLWISEFFAVLGLSP